MIASDWQLHARLPTGFELRTYRSLDSSNAEAKRLAAAGAADGTLVVCGEQLQGRGRGGHAWTSPPGNLYSTLLLRPAVTPQVAAELSFAAALAVYDTVRDLCPGAPVLVKWPNDVLVDGRKISGILLESASGRSGGVDWLVIGVGINVESHPEGPGIAATSLHELGAGDVDVARCLEVYAAALARWCLRWQEDGFPALRQGWLERCGGVGRTVRVRLARSEFSGVFRDLDVDGALVVELPDGEVRRVTAGDVFFAA